jgi:hypothetical protein
MIVSIAEWMRFLETGKPPEGATAKERFECRMAHLHAVCTRALDNIANLFGNAYK